MNNNSKAREITYIAVGVATMIVGGMAIFQMSLVFPIPGVKFILMAPYLSMLFFILLSTVKQNNALLKIGCTLGFIMMTVNIFMGFTILLTSLLSQLALVFVPRHNKALYGAVLFSGFTGACSLTISKFIIGGIFLEISNLWIVMTGLICLCFGIVGTRFAKKIIKYLLPALQ